jgi:hypothetical protein
LWWRCINKTNAKKKPEQPAGGGPESQEILMFFGFIFIPSADRLIWPIGYFVGGGHPAILSADHLSNLR